MELADIAMDDMDDFADFPAPDPSALLAAAARNLDGLGAPPSGITSELEAELARAQAELDVALSAEPPRTVNLRASYDDDDDGASGSAPPPDFAAAALDPTMKVPLAMNAPPPSMVRRPSEAEEKAPPPARKGSWYASMRRLSASAAKNVSAAAGAARSRLAKPKTDAKRPSKRALGQLLALRCDFQLRAVAGNDDYEAALAALWASASAARHAATGAVPGAFERRSETWMDFGFSTPNPDIEAAEGGFLVVRCLVDLGDRFEDTLAALFRKGVPVGAAAVGLCGALADFLDLGAPRDAPFAEQLFWGAFDDLSLIHI